jgi:hypothetical protein
MPRVERLDNYRVIFGRGEGVDPQGNVMMLTAVRLVSQDEQHIVEIMIDERARVDWVANLTGGIHPVGSFPTNDQGR